MPMRLGYRKAEDDKRMEKYEVAALLHAARNIELDARAYYMLSLMYFLGLRIGEVILLRWEHFVPPATAGGLPYVRVPTLKQHADAKLRQFETSKDKSGETERRALLNLYRVPVLSSPALVRFIFDKGRQTGPERAAKSPWLFTGTDPAAHLSKKQADRVFTNCREAARLRPGLTPHAMRYSATMALKRWQLGELRLGTVDMRTQAAFLRHTSVTVTERYVGVDAWDWERYRGALDLPPLAPLPAR